MSVHDIEEMPVRARVFGAADFVVKASEIAGEDGWSDESGMHGRGITTAHSTLNTQLPHSSHEASEK